MTPTALAGDDSSDLAGRVEKWEQAFNSGNKDAEGATVLSGKWLNVSKKLGGTWLIHRDIWNTDAPE